MDRKNFYFGQIVTESDLDQVFDWAEDADRDQSVDQALTGIHAGLAVSEQAVPDMTVQVTGGTATSPDGERINEAAPTTTVDCAVDRYGLSTAVTAAGDEKYLAVYVRFARNETNPAVDDNGVTVFTRAYEDSEFIVEQGAQAVVPTAVPPVLLTDAVHLCDIHLLHAQVAVTNADIDEARRGDWLREVLANRGTTAVYGTPQSACADLWQVVDALAGAGGADDVGADDYTTANAHVAWAGATTQDALEATADAIDGHIVGAAPNHPAGAITTVSIVGTPESEGLASDVQAVFDNVYGHLNDRTERAISERVNADSWDMFDEAQPVVGDDGASRLRGVVTMGTQLGGSLPMGTTLEQIASKIGASLTSIRPISSPTLEAEAVGYPGELIAGSVLVIRNSGTLSGRKRRLIATVTSAAGVAGSGNAGEVRLADALAIGGVVALATLGSLPIGAGRTWCAMSVCSDGPRIFVLFHDPVTTNWRVQAYDATSNTFPKVAAWPATGIDPSGINGAAVARRYRIIMADSETVVTVNGHVELAAGVSPALSKFNAVDGGGLATGLGDATPSAAAYATGGICSDGVNLYFVFRETIAGDGVINTARIANLGLGRFGWLPITIPSTGITADSCHDLCWTGESVIAPAHSGKIFAASTEQISASYSEIMAHPKFARLAWACFDGLKVWTLGVSTGDVLCAIGIDASIAAHSPATGVMTLAEMSPSIIPLMRIYDSLSPIANIEDVGPLMFDGDAVWAVANDGMVAGSTELIGYVRPVRVSSRR